MEIVKEKIYSITVEEARKRAMVHESDDSWDLWEDLCQKKDIES